MVITGRASTLKCCSCRCGEANAATLRRRPAISNPAALRVTCELHSTGTKRGLLIGRFLRVRSSAPANPLFAGTLRRDNPARFRSVGLRVRFFHTKRCSCQRWQDSDAKKPTRPNSNWPGIMPSSVQRYSVPLVAEKWQFAYLPATFLHSPSYGWGRSEQTRRLLRRPDMRPRARAEALRRTNPAASARSPPRARSVLNPKPYRGSGLLFRVARATRSKHARAHRFLKSSSCGPRLE